MGAAQTTKLSLTSGPWHVLVSLPGKPSPPLPRPSVWLTSTQAPGFIKALLEALLSSPSWLCQSPYVCPDEHLLLGAVVLWLPGACAGLLMP